jgi:peptide/nickel transport system substrate-binding protein
MRARRVICDRVFAVRRVAARLSLAVVVSAVASGAALAGKADNSVRFALNQTLPNLDPYFNSQAQGAWIGYNVWDSLLDRNPDTGEIVPNLATAWRWVDDSTLELDLRQGVKFHDGEPFGADDVVYTFNFVADPKNKAVRGDLREWLDHAEKVDDYRVRLHAKSVYPAALGSLAAPMVVIHPHRYYAEVGPQGMSAHPIGTGPFRVAEYALGKSLTLERNPDYFRGGSKATPRVDRVEIRFVPDATTQVAEVVAGRLDLITGVTHDQAEQLRSIPSLTVTGEEAPSWYQIYINTLPNGPVPQLRDLRVRRAIAHAIDRATIARALQGPGARLQNTECFRTQFGCTDEGAPRYDYDPVKARALLAEAGLPNGFPLDLYYSNLPDQAEAVANYLRVVGIDVHLRRLQTGALVAAMRAGRTPAVFLGSSVAGADVGVVLLRNHGLTGYDMNHDTEIRDLLVRGNSVLDEAERRKAYAEALRLISERAYAIELYTVVNYSVAAKDLVVLPHPGNALPRFYEMYYR